MRRRSCLVLSVASLFLALACSDRHGSGRRVLEARGQTSDTANLVVRRLWHGPQVDTQGAVSPDGQLLSFIDWGPGGNGSLAVRNLATGEIRTVVKATGGANQFTQAEVSVFSADGQQLAYTWNESGDYSLRTVPLTGGSPRIPYQNADMSWVDPKHWSADGRQILAVLAMNDRTRRLGIITVSDGSFRSLKSFDWRSPSAAAFSPDGRYVAYSFPPRPDVTQRDVYILSVDGSRETVLSEDAADDRLLGWHSSGEIWFVSDRGGTPAIWAAPVENGRVNGRATLVKPDVWRYSSTFGFDRAGNLFYAVQPTSRTVYTATLDTGAAKFVVPPTPVSGGIDQSEGGDWSPDGASLAYATNPLHGLPIISIRSLQSGDVRELKPSMRYIQRLTWFPGGESLLALGLDDTGRYGTYRIDSRSGAIVAAYRRPTGGMTTPMVSADGSTLYYSSYGTNGWIHIFRRDLKSDKETELYRFRGNHGAPSLSRDGRELAFPISEAAEGDPSSIWVMNTDGTNRRLVYRFPDGTSSSTHRGPLVWTHDGHLLFVRVGRDKETTLWRVPVRGGEATRLDIDLPSIRGFRLHPDGKRVVFDAGERTFEIWTVEHKPATTASR